MEGSKNNTYVLAGSIILAGLIIAFGIFAVNKGDTSTPEEQKPDETSVSIDISAVGEEDYIIGSRDAKLVIVEYSDTECPFCKDFHNTMNSVMEKYKNGNDVAWVYRHFPLTSIHPKASTEAVATECAGEVGGNDGFWRYINRLYEITPSNNNLDLDLLPQIAKDVRLDVSKFEVCLDKNTYRTKISNSYDEAVSVGATGTPFNVFVLKEPMSPEVLAGVKQLQSQFRPGQLVVADDGTRVSIGGALSEQGIESFITLLLGNVDSTQSQ